MQTTLQEFEVVLVELRDTLENLVGNLKEEKEAIVGFDLKAIADSHRKKQDQLSKIEALEKKWQMIVQQLGKELNVSGEIRTSLVMKYLPENEMTNRLKNHLSCVRSLVQSVQELNEMQRLFVAHSLSNVQASLTLLEHLQGRGAVVCYNKKGMMARTQKNEPSRLMNRNL